MNIINKLNNYDWNDEEINNVKDYILKNNLPIFRSYALQKRFIEKYKNFIVQNNKLFYKPLNLEVIPNDKRLSVLQRFYDDFKAIGNGKTALYKKN